MASSLDLKALDVFLRKPVSPDMVQKLVVKTLQVIPCQDKPPTAKGGKPLPSLMTFISRLVKYTNVYTGTLMASLVILDKLKARLPKNAQGLPCTRHRIFLSCLILASKFHNDSSPKNAHWAGYTDGLFSLNDVNLMERQLLFLLNWDVRVHNEDMVEQLADFLQPIKEDLINAQRMQKFLERQSALADAAHTSTNSRLSSISRSSSTVSALSLDHFDASHGRHSSCSSVGSLSPSLVKRPQADSYEHYVLN